MLIQCLAGPTEQVVCGETYVFAFDQYRRAVATVHDARHGAVFTGLEIYKEVPAIPEDLPELNLPTGPTPEEIAAEEARLQAEEQARIDAATKAAEEAQARAEEEDAARVRAAAEAQALLNAAVPPVNLAPPTAAPADAASSTSDNLDAAASTGEPVTLPTPKTRRGGARKAAAK